MEIDTSRIKKIAATIGIASFITVASYCIYHEEQIKDSYKICSIVNDVGKEAISRNITKENISHPENKDIVKFIEFSREMLQEHKKKYGFNLEDNEVNWQDLPTLIGSFRCSISSDYPQTENYLKYQVRLPE